MIRNFFFNYRAIKINLVFYVGFNALKHFIAVSEIYDEDQKFEIKECYPDRLFLEIEVRYPEEYYFSPHDTKHIDELHTSK